MKVKSTEIFVILYIELTFCWITKVYSCPTMCVCKWKGGKQSVDCSSKDLVSIPYGIDPGTQVLDFSGNNLRVLQTKRFFNLDLVNLQRIYLSKCNIASINDKAFVGLNNLVELDLSQNSLVTIPSITFVDFPQLMRLSLSDNPIKRIQSFAFHDLSFLVTLELSSCEIETVEDEAFAGLNNLEWLKLDGNHLSFIRGIDSLPSSLHGIDLHNNRWVCDCRLLDLHTWLTNFNIPLVIEPKCSRPQRLVGRTIKSIDINDLACLPDISPTTLYLEIGEGKNISLLCKVSSIPEAHVSWWFRGNLLQNDTSIAPGFHLLYYIEEGTVEKKSELFIYNTNTEDNGTFICAAENPAGKSMSNYTIKVIVKEEPIIVVVQFPFEYIIAITIGVSLLVIFLIVTCLCIFITKCRGKHKVRKKKNCSKDVLQGQQSISKCSVVCENSGEVVGEPIKTNGNLASNDRQIDSSLYPIITGSNLIIDNISTVSCIKQLRSPPIIKNYSQDQNPDLINDTESVGGRKVETSSENQNEINIPANFQKTMDRVIDELIESTLPRRVQWSDKPILISNNLKTIPVLNTQEFYQHAADIHLNPSCFFDSDGYSFDYGLPKQQLPQLIANPENRSNCFYRTLPHNRKKVLINAPPNLRYSREAEFLSHSSQPEPYEHYNTDIRYTLEGYPCNKPLSPSTIPENYIPSPPEEYKVTNDCCDTNKNKIQIPKWPPCLPSSIVSNVNQLSPRIIQKKCVGAQTEDKSVNKEKLLTIDDESNSNEHFENISKAPKPSKTAINSQHMQESLTESPDEGYVGDGNDNNEI